MSHVHISPEGDHSHFHPHFVVWVVRFSYYQVTYCEWKYGVLFVIIDTNPPAMQIKKKTSWRLETFSQTPGVGSNLPLPAFNNDVIMSAMASQISGLPTVCPTVCLGADQRRHQSSASLAFVRGIHRLPVDSPHNGPVTGKMFSFDDVIMITGHVARNHYCWHLCPGTLSFAQLFATQLKIGHR